MYLEKFYESFNPDSALDFVMRKNMISSHAISSFAISSLATRREGRKNENQRKYEGRFFRDKFLIRMLGLNRSYLFTF